MRAIKGRANGIVTIVAALLLVSGLLATALPAPVEANPAKTGIIKDTFPPGNNGLEKGAGRITEDGTGTIYIFQTPDDLKLDPRTLPLREGDRVTFENPRGRQATDIIKIAP